jgi:hypothetical protein
MCAAEISRLLRISDDNFKRIDKRGEKIAFLTGARKDYVEDIQYPQSLGEPCLEVAEDKFQQRHLWTDRYYPCDLFALRLAMYRRNR